MFKSLLIFSIFIISVPSMATDYTFKEKSPADRVYSENYQGIDTVKQQQRFVFDPKRRSLKRSVIMKIYWLKSSNKVILGEIGIMISVIALLSPRDVLVNLHGCMILNSSNR
ncbi:hypothetical protein AB6G19_07285 [Providencia manganoxydans]